MQQEEHDQQRREQPRQHLLIGVTEVLESPEDVGNSRPNNRKEEIHKQVLVEALNTGFVGFYEAVDGEESLGGVSHVLRGVEEGFDLRVRAEDTSEGQSRSKEATSIRIWT